ncbi:hypothetical protein HDU91_005087 [Kappamyces sp. JEL0680]|nr:hypothetical protein HDU91_005087 [Kappamyces sp. JEL0680]
MKRISPLVAVLAATFVSAEKSFVSTVFAGSYSHTTPLDGPPQVNGFGNPYLVAQDPATQSLFITDAGDGGSNNVRAVNSTGWASILAGTSGQEGSKGGSRDQATFSTPVGIRFDPLSGFVYVMDSTGLLRQINPSTGWTQNVNQVPGQVQFIGDFLLVGGGVVVADTMAGTLTFLDENFAVLKQFSNLGMPAALAQDDGGNIYIASQSMHQIKVYNATTDSVSRFAGSYLGKAGSNDGNVLDATFNVPCGLALDTALGVLYISDNQNYKIRMLNLTSRMVTTFAGTGTMGTATGPALSSTFQSPYGLALSPNGTLFVVDEPNNGKGGVIRSIYPQTLSAANSTATNASSGPRINYSLYASSTTTQTSTANGTESVTTTATSTLKQTAVSNNWLDGAYGPIAAVESQIAPQNPTGFTGGIQITNAAAELVLSISLPAVGALVFFLVL